MFMQKKWTATGASGAKYLFSILPKSDGLPQSAGVFILAYCHPRGHMAGWQVNPLFIGHADNMGLALENEVELDSDHMLMWNCNFVLLESVTSAREICVRDLENQKSKSTRTGWTSFIEK
jgi:hypothetical protein